MPRFFLHLHECGTVLSDEEGVELASLQIAHDRAVEAAREVMSEEVKHGRLCLSCCIVIENSDHDELERLPFRDTIAVTGL